MHYYQFNIGDYRKDTAHLTPMEHYIYRTLIDWYYLDETPIPTETQVVIRRLSIDFSFEQSLNNVLNDFFVLEDKGWEHKRIKVEILGYHEQCVKNQVNGKLGGRPRKTQVVSKPNPKEPNRNPNQEPLTNNHKPNKTPSATGVAYTDSYLSFWKLYPNKKNKGEGFKAFKKIPAVEYPIIKDGLLTAIKSSDWLKDNGKYIPHPASWLNSRGWEDEPNDRQPKRAWET